MSNSKTRNDSNDDTQQHPALRAQGQSRKFFEVWCYPCFWQYGSQVEPINGPADNYPQERYNECDQECVELLSFL